MLQQSKAHHLTHHHFLLPPLFTPTQVVLKDVLLPFVISIFLVYLLRPLVNVLTTPFGQWCGCFLPHHPTHAHLHHPPLHHTGLAKRPVGVTAPASGYASETSAGGDSENGGGPTRAGRARTTKRSGGPSGRGSSPTKIPKTLRSLMARATGALSDLMSSLSGTSGGGGNNNNGARAEAREVIDPSELACCCGVCRMTKCPRWFAILIALCIVVTVISVFVIAVADAIQRFQQESLNAFVDEAGALINRLQRWLAGFGISLEGSAILEALKQQINVASLVKTTVTVIVDGIGNGVLILLLVLYLLAEQSSHASGSVRARVDDQIQRYIGIKTIISLAQGVLVYFIMGWMLGVRMAHLFGALHFILNFIPTVRERVGRGVGVGSMGPGAYK